MPYHQISDDQLKSFIHGVNSSINLSILDKINELDNLLIEDRDDNSILSEIDPDLNMLFNMNDTIKNSSRYFETSHFRTSFHKYKHYFSILNANMRGMATNLDKLNLFIEDLDYTFPIIGITETWLKSHNVDGHFINEYDIRLNRTGGGVSLFVANSLMYTRRKDIQLNSIFNSIILDIDKSDINSKRNVSVIIVYRPPNTIFIKDMEKMFTILTSEN